MQIKACESTALFVVDDLLQVAASTTGICYYVGMCKPLMTIKQQRTMLRDPALRYGLGKHAEHIPEKDMERFLIVSVVYMQSLRRLKNELTVV